MYDNQGFLYHHYQDLQGLGMTEKLALPTLIAICSIALGKPTMSSLAVLGEISIAGTMLKVDELANALQVCVDSGAKKVLLPITSAVDLGTVPADLIGCFNLIFYQSAEDAVFESIRCRVICSIPILYMRRDIVRLSMVRKSCDGSRKLVGVRVLRRQRSDAQPCCGAGGHAVGVTYLSR